MAGFSVPKKKFKKAVVRNRIKRRLKESWRKSCIHVKQELTIKKKNLVVWLLYKEKAELELAVLEQEVQFLCNYLRKKI